MSFDWKSYMWDSVDYRITALEVDLNHNFRKSKRLSRLYNNVYPVALDCRRFKIEPMIADSMVTDFVRNINMIYSIELINITLSQEENYIFNDIEHLHNTINHYESLLRDLIYLHRCSILYYNTNGLNYLPQRIEEYGEFIMSIGETINYVDDILDKLNLYLLTGIENSLIADIASFYI